VIRPPLSQEYAALVTWKNQEDEEELMELLDLAMVSVQALPSGMGGVIGLALGIGLVYLVIRIIDR
jgi:hypothetical protein